MKLFWIIFFYNMTIKCIIFKFVISKVQFAAPGDIFEKDGGFVIFEHIAGVGVAGAGGMCAVVEENANRIFAENGIEHHGPGSVLSVDGGIPSVEMASSYKDTLVRQQACAAVA